jgi:hypothetical protein
MTAPEDRDVALRAWVEHVAQADPNRRRFGARHHDYRWRPPLADARVAAIEDELGVALPAAYRRFVTALGDGGVGPYGGVMPLDHPVQRAAAAGEFRADARDGRALFRGVIGLGHIGCGQIAFVIVRSADPGALPGEVWIDARASGGGVDRIEPDFEAYYARWIAELTYNRLPRTFVAPGACALPAVLSQFLQAAELRAGVAPGTLAAPAMREAFAALPIDAIRLQANGDDPFFDDGDPIDPCPACEVLLTNLGAQGLARDRVKAGENPLPARRSPG